MFYTHTNMFQWQTSIDVKTAFHGKFPDLNRQFCDLLPRYISKWCSMFIKYRRIYTVDVDIDLDVTVDVQLLCMQDIQTENFCTTTATLYSGQLYIFQYFDVIFMDHIFHTCHATQTRFHTVLVEEFLVISAIWAICKSHCQQVSWIFVPLVLLLGWLGNISFLLEEHCYQEEHSNQMQLY